MERKYATVLAITFVLVGLMFFSVDTPISISHQVKTDTLDSPTNINEIAEEPISQGPLTMNVISNPSFEEWNTGLHGPEDWDTRGDGYAFGDPAYTGTYKNGNYAGLVECHAGTNMPGSSPLFTNPDTTEMPYLKYGISVSLDWYLIANPDILSGARLYIMLGIQNVTGN